ncbi:unnamed protein product [Caenorhabditis bovis]|uniref:Uncharacterized protein n=1 Tax=Caenorhabditis bovis TaxID=2654633 RepID=A0A8S1FAZ1_9PELO|nr:unnamed protein product [Caenorhabditis bovis]
MKVFVLLSLVVLASSRSVVKRNAYGDEAVTPAPAAAPAPEAAPVEQAPVAVPAPAPAAAPAPDCGAAAPAPAAPASTDSGYRAKRNAYGDEAVTPAPAAAPAPEATPAEQAPVAVPAPAAPAPAANCGGAAPAPAAPASTDSGYRAKRNAYGDEAVTPAPAAAPAPEAAPAEQAPVAVPAPAAAPAPDCGAAAPAPAAPASTDSGYPSRVRRNAYGDELVTPEVGGAQVEIVKEVDASTVSQAENAAQSTNVENSGYRAKRMSQNAYGDEAVTQSSDTRAHTIMVVEHAPVAVDVGGNSQGIEVVGPCVNNMCPHSYTCNRDECIREKPKARAGAKPIGPCVNAQCPVGHVCISNDNKCYPLA